MLITSPIELQLVCTNLRLAPNTQYIYGVKEAAGLLSLIDQLTDELTTCLLAGHTEVYRWPTRAGSARNKHGQPPSGDARSHADHRLDLLQRPVVCRYRHNYHRWVDGIVAHRGLTIDNTTSFPTADKNAKWRSPANAADACAQAIPGNAFSITILSTAGKEL